MAVKRLFERIPDEVFINPKCAKRNKSRLLFLTAEMFKKPLWQTVWTQIRLLLSVCSGSTLFASILNSSVIPGNYLQQTTSADNIFRGIFLRVNIDILNSLHAG